jgi:hypothetical protein
MNPAFEFVEYPGWLAEEVLRAFMAIEQTIEESGS